MALPASGSITAAMINVELGRASNAPFSLNGTAERGLAGRASGSISFGDFLGKSSEIAKTLAAGAGLVSLQSLFTSAEWTSDTTKRVILPAGSERGNTNAGQAAVQIGAAFGGTLIFDVAGTISGAAGAANSGVGGTAFNANTLGLSGQKLLLNLTGTLRAGGGGGGKGGQGGNGTANVREPASGSNYSGPTGGGVNPSNDVTTGVHGRFFDKQFRWGGANIGGVVGYNVMSITSGAYTYYDVGYSAGTPPYNWDDGQGMFYGYNGRIYRTSTGTTTGGAGGNGGRGEGYTLGRADGSAGAAGGANAGTGSTGGRGGLYGATGTGGASGSNGNATGGLAGIAGGLAGFAIANLANTTLTNNGTLLGRT